MNKLSPSQAEQIKEIGTYLQQKRLEKSLTLEDIASLTMIRLPMLVALEEGALEQLPELIYIKGFIRRYAEALKMDGQTLANSLFQVTETPAADPLSLTNTKPVQTISAPSAPPKDSKPKPPVAAKPANNINLNWIYLLLGVWGLLCGLWYVLSRPNQPEIVSPTTPSPSLATPKAENLTTTTAQPSPTIAQQIEQPPATPPPSPIPSSDPIKAPAPVTSPSSTNLSQQTKPSPAAQETPLSVTVELKDQSWLKVVVDGKTDYVGILESGEQKTWTAKKNLSIRAGNAGAVKLSVNQKPSEALGKPGEVKEIVLTPD